MAYPVKRPRKGYVASPQSIIALATVRNNPAKREQALSQIKGFNFNSAAGFPALLKYIDDHLGLDAEELSRAFPFSQSDIESWSTPQGHPPNSLDRKAIADFALKRLEKP